VKQPRRRQADRREEAAARLLDAAIDLVAERGYDGFSLAELGEKANFSRGLPSHYFGSKANLLGAVVGKIIDDFMNLREGEGNHGATFDRLEQVLWRYIESAQAGRPHSKALHAIVGAALINPELRPRIQELNDRGRAFIRAQLQLGVEAKDIAADVNIDAEAVVFLAFLRGLVVLYLVDPSLDIEAAAREFLLHLRARLTPR